MRRTHLTVLTLLASLASVVGCSVVASHSEYSAYRRVRQARNDHDFLVAAQEYVQHNPHGLWTTDVQRRRHAQEDGVWERSNATLEGLQWYLRVYPDGEYAGQARPRLAALQTVSSRRQGEQRRLGALDAAQRRRLEEARRLWVTTTVQFWTRTLIGIRNFGAPIQRVAAGNEQFNNAFAARPAPACTQDYCIKHWGQLYHIPVPGATRIDRQIDVYLRLKLDHGRLERAEVILPSKGFSRWYEMENRTVVTDEDQEQRTAAINWALERIQPVVQQVAAGAQRVDVVPVPLEPLQVRSESSNSDQAPTAPGTRKQDGDDVIDDLLRGASGEQQPAQPAQPPARGRRGRGRQPPAQQQPPPPAQAQTPPPQQQGGGLSLPIGLMAWTHHGLRVVIFAAGPDDYDQGYDGFYVERVR